MAVEGLSHITFIVRDLDRMETILTQLLGARCVYDSGKASHSLSPERFYRVGSEHAVWIAVMQSEGGLPRSYNHVAFKIAEERFDHCLHVVEQLGLEIRPPRPRIEGEARSIYFYDDDNHMIELHTGTLEQRLASYEARNAS